ncbi:MAG: hypothetical protein IPH52_08040 [Leptospiraceae bacterium]|nr:hypothetical protein [Leptospiraceae bacterium]
MLRIILLFFLIFLFSCSDMDGVKKRQETKKTVDFYILTLVQIRAKGNCLRKDSSTNTVYCDRRSSGLCNLNELLLSSSEKAYNLTEANDLVKAVPSCSFSFLNSGISSDAISTIADQDTFKANNTYSVITSCESTGIGSPETLITESELIFLNSSRGRIAIAADKVANTPDLALALTLPAGTSASQIKSDARSCLSGGFPEAEKDLVTDLRTLKRVKTISCSSKSGVTNACPF